MEPITAESPEAQSADLIAENIKKLKDLFPELVTEAAQGHSVNVDVLKQLVGDQTVTDVEEKYGLNWHGKRAARKLALTPSLGTLRPCPEDSVDWENTQNLFIEGDNLEVLKLLQKSYAGKVKLIYIDPPYNTGKDFVYPDNFKDNIRNYKELTGQVDSEGRSISSNSEASGRFHTDWLNMILPRLKVARNLLREDGVIFISISDVEASNLTGIFNEVFGEENYVATLVWEKGRKNDAKLVSVGHEYILVYTKRKSYFQENKIRWREAKPGAKDILDEYIRLRELHGEADTLVEEGIRMFYESLPKDHPSKKHARYNKVDARGVWRDDNMSWPGGGGPDYDVIHPSTGIACSVPDGGWRYSTIEKMQEMIECGKVVFRDDHSEPPIRKTYLVEIDETDDSPDDDPSAESEDLPIQVAGSYFYRSALQASNELTKLFSKKVFNNPKDRETLARWIKYVGVSGSDIVMDFFAGSGTTGHAVLDLDFESSFNIRYLLVQLPELINPKAKGAKQAIAYLKNVGKPRNIAELTKERLRRAAAKIKVEHPDYDGDLGFRVFKLDSSNIKAWNAEAIAAAQTDEEQAALLNEQVDHLLADRTEDDILYELLLKLGLDLCVPIEQREIAGKTVYSVGAGVLMVCLADSITYAESEALAQGMVDWHKALAPATEVSCVFRDSGFADDKAKANTTAILEQAGLKKVRSI